ncbi:TetR/AcrR family transcriptional regulator [Actinotalea subterranea]|uniref:TetR/AcrR family transcriptional regulator n=1 Tax=Actinotalea subterranea TaxID=2607497 RepID=UPI00165DE05B|nr:TetR/AcrR family transcriptional regulator [Actinotalea subterranea]
MTAEPVPSRRRANTRARLLEAAAEVFADKGLGAATVDDLAGAAGFTRGAFYSNFSTKEDLFFALFEALSARMVDSVRETVESAPDYDLGLIGAVLERLRPQARAWYIVQTEYLLLAMRNPEVGRQFAAHRNKFEGEFADVVMAALTRLGRRPTLPVEQLTEALASLYMKNLAVEALAGDAPRRDGEPGRFIADTLPAVLLGLSEPLA